MALAPLAATPADQTRLPPTPVAPEPFHVWRSHLIDDAARQGISRDLAATVLGSLQPSPRVVRSDRAQAASPANVDASLAEALTPDRIAKGRQKMHEHRALLDRIERWFGVQRRFVVAIWGLESSYGAYTFDVPVFQALATLAWEGRRAEYFRAELFDALHIAQRGHIDVAAMRGSWAGAMGQPQFMPSSYLKYAYDFDGDGHRDIWRSTPDTLASIANYLRSVGWRNDETWGREISMTAAVRARASNATGRTDGCSAMRTLTRPRPLRDWAREGIRLATGSRLPRAPVSASVLLAAEARGFLVYRNYESILRYNCSHSYALSVGMLADRIR
jgi:membrane-bound lytic murein transglycosylase B